MKKPPKVIPAKYEMVAGRSQSASYEPLRWLLERALKQVFTSALKKPKSMSNGSTRTVKRAALPDIPIWIAVAAARRGRAAP